MEAMKGTGSYPTDWASIATLIKDAADWKCIRCGHDHDSVNGYVLTVHHLDGDKSNCRWWNCPALCQRCHLTIQGHVIMNRAWIFTHTPWFQPYAAGFYAYKYLGLDLMREEVMERLPELLGLEAQAILGSPPISLEAR